MRTVEKACLNDYKLCRIVVLMLAGCEAYAIEVGTDALPQSGVGPKNVSSLSTFWAIVGVVALFGAFGGILAALSEISLQRIRDEGIAVFGGAARLWACTLISGLQGVGGALAFAGTAALDGKLDPSAFDGQKCLTFALLSVATGFAGHKFLLLISRKLTAEVEQEIEKSAEKVKKQLESESQKRGRLEDARQVLVTILSESDEQTFKAAAREGMQKAEAARRDFPTDRRLGILMGRVNLRLSGYDSAISLLSQFIAERQRNKLDNDADFAALLYNRACYRNRKAEEDADAAHQEAMRKSAWEDLKLSCRLDPPNREEAKNDPDLTTLFNEGERNVSKL